jgi:hypothetical protein
MEMSQQNPLNKYYKLIKTFLKESEKIKRKKPMVSILLYFGI